MSTYLDYRYVPYVDQDDLPGVCHSGAEGAAAQEHDAGPAADRRLGQRCQLDRARRTTCSSERIWPLCAICSRRC